MSQVEAPKIIGENLGHYGLSSHVCAEVPNSRIHTQQWVRKGGTSLYTHAVSRPDY